MERFTQKAGLILLATVFVGSGMGALAARVWADEVPVDPPADSTIVPPVDAPADPALADTPTDPNAPPVDDGTVSTQ